LEEVRKPIKKSLCSNSGVSDPAPEKLHPTSIKDLNKLIKVFRVTWK